MPISDPDYCRCGATVRLDPQTHGISFYFPPTSPKHGHRHEWQKERTTVARHAKDPAFTLHVFASQAFNAADVARIMHKAATVR